MLGTDNEDFRSNFRRIISSWKPKQLRSVAHVHGKPRAMAEALSGADGTISLEEVRYDMNMPAMCGIKSFVFHLFHYAAGTPLIMDK